MVVVALVMPMIWLVVMMMIFTKTINCDNNNDNYDNNIDNDYNLTSFGDTQKRQQLMPQHNSELIIVVTTL